MSNKQSELFISYLDLDPTCQVITDPNPDPTCQAITDLDPTFLVDSDPDPICI